MNWRMKFLLKEISNPNIITNIFLLSQCLLLLINWMICFIYAKYKRLGMVSVIGNGTDDLSSNLDRAVGVSLPACALGKGIKSYVLLQAIK